MRLVAVATLVAMLMLPSVSAAWSAYHGGPDRNVRVVLPGGPMDVVRVAETPEAFTNTYWGSRGLPTPSGIVLLEDTDEGCNLLVVAPPYESVTRSMPVDACNFGLIVGYDPVQDAIILCDNTPVDGDTLRALRVADASQLWSVVPERDLNAPVGTLRWLCVGAAIDVASRQYAVGFEAYGEVSPNGVDHVVVLGDLDHGSVAWRADLPAAPPAIPLNTGAAPETHPRSIYPRGMTLTSTGVIVSGFYGCGPGQTVVGVLVCVEEGFVAWFTREGDYRGMESALKPGSIAPATSGIDANTPYSRAVSQYAVASGPIAAVALGTEVLLINPDVPAPVLRGPMAAVEGTTSGTFWYSGAWTEGQLIVPILTSITAFDPATLEPKWSYTEGLGSRFTDILVTTGGETYVLFTDVADFVHHLVILKTATGELVRRIPIPGDIPDEHKPGGWRAHMVPLEGEGIAIVDLMGSVVVLGAADAAIMPTVEVSDAYPDPGEEIALRIDPRGARAVRITWGDGSEETLDANATARHSFVERGPRDVAVTSLFDDGTTATRTLVLDVGGTPPPQLTTLQRAFSPEYQNWTFFVLGTLITVVGLAVTVGRQRRRFNKLERELGAVEEIRMLSVEDPRGAVVALKAYRARLPQDLAKRRIDDSQYQVLDLRSARLLKVLRTRLFAPFDAELSARYHRLLDAAFEDAILQPAERDALLRALDAEPAVDAATRAEIAAVLADFTTERADVWAA